ncbi:hypothetical protein ETI06_05910 [Macrococcoides goetzii]|nr:hypothetical protein [Macrococcus goetzii]TDM50007.1 hypothetical protein ETI06_05910 [Macrococcus goetzii]
MNLKGIRLNTSFFPTLDTSKTVVNKNYNGATASFSHNTDTVAGDYVEKEISAFKNNTVLSAFVSPFSSITDVDNINITGAIEFGIYIPTDRWADPRYATSTDIMVKYPLIPDYNSSTWTQASIDAGFNVTLGATKTTKYPNHGQQLFDVSGGKYGYDLKNNVVGQTDVTTPLILFMKQWFKEKFRYNALTASYRNGASAIEYMLKDHFLNVRNSINDNNTDYSLSMQKSSTTRQGDMDTTMTREEILNTVRSNLETTLSTGGWYTDFTHWHTAPKGEIDEFLNTITTTTGTRNLAKVGYKTATEYKALADNIGVVGVKSYNDSVLVAVKVKNDKLIQEIQTNLFVNVNLTDTPLANKEITCDYDIYKISMNNFMIAIPVNNVKALLLRQTDKPQYKTLNKPQLVSSSKTLIKTDVETNIVIYSVATGGSINDVTVVTRSTEYKTDHVINLSDTTKDYYCGMITKNKMMNLVKFNI